MSEHTEEIVILSKEEAVSMLPEGDTIHTFRSVGSTLLGADCDRKELIAKFDKYEIELSGPMATQMKHGIAIRDDQGPLFIETKEKCQGDE